MSNDLIDGYAILKAAAVGKRKRAIERVARALCDYPDDFIGASNQRAWETAIPLAIKAIDAMEQD